MRPLNIGIEAAHRKIRYFCSYQERNHQEVKEKLYSFGLYKAEVEELISTMIEEDYLNEERFAEAFAGGKFRIKQWGRVKIKNEMQQKRLSPYCIKKGLAVIEEKEYLSTLEKLGKKKLDTLQSEKNIFVRKTKIRNYLLQKGYEANLVLSLVNDLCVEKK